MMVKKVLARSRIRGTIALGGLLLCCSGQVGCISRKGCFAETKQYRQIIVLDGPKEMWGIACRLSASGQDKDAFVILRTLVEVYPMSPWAVKARGLLTKKEYRSFDLPLPVVGQSVAVPAPKSSGLIGARLRWEEMKDKKSVTDQFGSPDGVVKPVPPESWEKWVYREKCLTVGFQGDQVVLIEVRDPEGNIVEGSATFRAHPEGNAGNVVEKIQLPR